MKRVVVIGGSGYTGLELLRILLRHPEVEIAAVTSERREDYRLHTIAEFDPIGRQFVRHTVPETLARQLALAGETLPEAWEVA